MSRPIDWPPPEPRPGRRGTLDRLTGPGATRAELFLQFPPAFAAGAIAAAHAYLSGFETTWWRLLVLGFLALDLTGGVLTNSTAAAKRWFHKEGATARGHIEFIAPHVLHTIALVFLFRGGELGYLAFLNLALFGGAIIVLRTPLYLMRPVASLLFIAALALDLYAFGPTPGLEWFAPLFFFKLWIAYLLPEAPFKRSP